MKNYIFRCIAASIFIISISTYGQAQDKKIPVSVSHSGDDSVGKQFAYAVREALRGSNGYRLTSLTDSGIYISIVTVDPERNSNSNGYWTAAAVTYTMKNFIPLEKGNPQTWYPIYLTTQVMTIGTQRTAEQARAVMATIDEQLEAYRRDAQK